ncbi:hypothetical protein RM530_16595 [Algiphilus sp. W345]|uniref:Ketopantoate reductase C-terminal domain-containing protein n=1 Tax=Banduia mediterranea TaxID=3075609 RepID=A0ABU2WM54_9GAMM|nr:hypothetical protein [Algiphilus sp. W345]MDT0498964.1 hypothetical protein [Algiphilus sp. W345]
MAAEGLLEIFAAGSRADLRGAEAALEVLATRVHYLGTAPEQAMLAKITAQFVRACAIETVREVEHLARASGLSAESLFVSFQRNLDLPPADTTTQTQQHEWVVEAARRNGIALPFAETLRALHAAAGRVTIGLLASKARRARPPDARSGEPAMHSQWAYRHRNRPLTRPSRRKPPGSPSSR